MSFLKMKPEDISRLLAGFDQEYGRWRPVESGLFTNPYHEAPHELRIKLENTLLETKLRKAHEAMEELASKVDVVDQSEEVERLKAKLLEAENEALRAAGCEAPRNSVLTGLSELMIEYASRAFLRFAAHLRHEFSRADRLKNTASAAANLPPPRYLIQQAMASPPTSDTAKIGSTSLKSTLGTSLLQTTGKGYAKKVTSAKQSLKAANADDMEIIRNSSQVDGGHSL